MQALHGKLAVVTGANTGIGRVTAAALAGRGARVVLACRSEAKARPVLEAIEAAGGEAELLALDLGDLESVRAAAAALEGRALHILVANAGLAGQRGLTRSGFELAFGVNHVGHALLVRLLEAGLRAAATPQAPARVVIVSSASHYQAKALDLEAVRQPTRSVTGMTEYEVSKLANVLFAKALARRWAPAIHTYSLHPGVVATDIWRRLPWPIRPLVKRFMLTEEQGAQTTIHCATAPELATETGRYYDACREKVPSVLALDEALADLLWARTAEWIGLPA